MAYNLSHEQFQQLLGVIGSGRRNTLTSCTSFYDGCKDSEALESFLAGVKTFKEIEKITDSEALAGLPLLLKDEAGKWWQGVKREVTTWDDFESRIRNSFAPKKPAFLIYRDIMEEKQPLTMPTETFLTKKRMLFSLLPSPEHPEKQQIDMLYHLLNINIREKIPRTSIKTYDELLQAAREVEHVIIEKQNRTSMYSQPEQEFNKKVGKVKCNYCRNFGHTAEDCLKKKKAETKRQHGPIMTAETQAPSPSQPKFSCYGCGAPGVVRTKCPTCSTNKPVKTEKKVDFCAVDVRTDVRARPVVFIGIGGYEGYAFVDTCAKASVASHSLYQKLKQQGHNFRQEQVNISLADGFTKKQWVLTVTVPVKICARTVITNFIVLPESRDNRTLLGIGFIEDAQMILNLPQFTWHFVDDEITEYELYDEDFVTFEKPNQAEPMPIMPRSDPTAPATKLFSMDTAKQWSEQPKVQEAALPQESAGLEYKVNKIDFLATPPQTKRVRTIFDGYSPFADFMMRDARLNIHRAEVDLSPHSKELFPGPDPYASDDIGINSLDIDLTFMTSGSILSNTQQQSLNKLLQQHEDVFIDNGSPALNVEHRIDTKDNGPIAVPPYRLSSPRKEVLRKEIDTMLSAGIIEPSVTPWAAPVVLVPKPNGETRVCVDYRKLNAITIPDTYPIPRIDDLLHEAKPTPFMSTLDLKAGYWQIRMRKEDKEKTGFITPFGIYVFNRMPFGLRNAPATFQRMIDRFRVSLENVKILAYLDDLVLFSSSFETHLADLEAVFLKLREYNLTVNLKKCRFGCSSIRYLGHYITPQGLQVDPEKTEAITKLAAPRNLRHLVSFLQTCSWYRRFIENFSKIAEPLTRLTKKNAPWIWAEEQEAAFSKLKHCLTSAPVLRQADESKPYRIKTDASNYAIGAVLVQGEREDEHPVEYASRLLTAAERNYSTTEREALAVVWAVTKFRSYIEGLPTEVVTDHQALRWLLSMKSPTGRLARWALQLQSYDLTVKYIPGRINVVADTLSRPSCTEENTSDCGICGVSIDMPTRNAAETRKEQIKDEDIAKIVKILENNDCPEDAAYWSGKGYFMNHGLLYRHNPNVDSDDAQLLVPNHEWANVLKVYHDDPLAGHYGSEKTYDRISKRYYWKGMRKYIEGYVRLCLACQRYKPSNLKPAGLLQTSPMNQRFEVVAFDLFGPLPMSSDGKTWIFIVEDVATRWVELFALETATAESCAKVLIDEIFLRFGVPRRLTSDNGTQFISAVMQQVTYCLQIKHTYTPVYHPQANPVERRNRDLKTQLAILVEPDHRQWPEQLPCIRFAMNSATCLSTGYSPAYLTFGRELRTPNDNENDLRAVILSENFIPEITPKLLQLADSLNRAKDIQEGKEIARKEYGDKKRRKSPNYRVGDHVLVTSHPISNATRGFSAKFAPRRDGPYVIMEQHGPASYVVANPQKPNEPVGIYHSSALAPYFGQEPTLPMPVQPLRKRGRPKKVNAALPSEGAPTAASRGRGRPRKVK